MTEQQVLIRRFVVLRALRWMPLGLALPFLVLLPQDRGLGLGEVGVVWAAHSVVAILLEVPSGGLADAVGRRATLLAGGLLSALALAGFGIASSLAGFMAAAAGIAAGRALISGALEAWFVDALRARDATAELHGPLARAGTAEGIAAAGAAAVGGLLPLLPLGLADSGDALLVELSIPALAGALVALGYVATIAAWVHEPNRTRASNGWRDAASVTRAGLGAARASHDIRIVLGVAVVVGLAMSTTELLWQPRLEDLIGTDAHKAAPLFGALAAASMLASSAGSMASARFAPGRSRRSLYGGGLAAIAATLAALAIAPAAALFCAVYLVYFAALGFVEPVHQEILHDAAEADTRATVASAEGLTGQVGGIGGNLLLAPLAGAAGTGIAWGVTAVVATAGALLARAAAPAPEREAARPRPRPAAPSGAA